MPKDGKISRRTWLTKFTLLMGFLTIPTPLTFPDHKNILSRP